MKHFAIIMCALLALAAMLVSCEEKQEELPAATTVGVPEQSEKGTVTEGDFTFTLYSTYASLTEYSGSSEGVVIPDTVQNLPVVTLGEKAFEGNETVKKVVLPENLRMIDRYAFENCGNLSEVVWNPVLESIADYAFRQSGIEDFSPECPLYSIGRNCFYGCERLKTVSLPETVTVVKEYCFALCPALESVSLSPRLTSLSNRLFSNDTALASVSVPESVTEIDTYAFAGCTALAEVTFGSDPTLKEGVFNGCSSLVLSVKTGSNLEKYASRNGIAFETAAE